MREEKGVKTVEDVENLLIKSLEKSIKDIENNRPFYSDIPEEEKEVFLQSSKHAIELALKKRGNK